MLNNRLLSNKINNHLVIDADHVTVTYASFVFCQHSQKASCLWVESQSVLVFSDNNFASCYANDIGAVYICVAQSNLHNSISRTCIFDTYAKNDFQTFLIESKSNISVKSLAIYGSSGKSRIFKVLGPYVWVSGMNTTKSRMTDTDPGLTTYPVYEGYCHHCTFFDNQGDRNSLAFWYEPNALQSRVAQYTINNLNIVKQVVNSGIIVINCASGLIRDCVFRENVATKSYLDTRAPKELVVIADCSFDISPSLTGTFTLAATFIDGDCTTLDHKVFEKYCPLTKAFSMRRHLVLPRFLFCHFLAT